nr:2'-5' RNA ligase family protein [Petropleomorpha daqingensis]
MSRAGLRRRLRRLGDGSATALVVPFRGLPLDEPAPGAPPRHVTVLFPFVGVRRADERLAARLREIFAPVPAFDVEFASVRRFPDALYLAPEPADRFRALTALAVAEWPDHPPYEGRFAEVVPHLTLAEGAEPAGLAERAEALLPLTARAAAVELLVPTRSGWATALSVPLA